MILSLGLETWAGDVRVPIIDEEDFEQLAITGRSRVPVDDDYARLTHAIRRDGSQRGRRVNPNMNYDAVDIARTQAGVDVRPTVGNRPPSSVLGLIY